MEGVEVCNSSRYGMICQNGVLLLGFMRVGKLSIRINGLWKSSISVIKVDNAIVRQ